MTQRNRLSRRAFLHALGGISGATVLLAACGGATTPSGGGTAATSAPAAGGAATSAPAAGGAATSAPAAGGAATSAPAAAGGGAATIHFLSGQAADEGYTKIIGALAKDYQAQHPDVKYEYEQSPQTGLDEKIALLAGSNNLPTLFADPATATLTEMGKKGLVLDIEKTFKDLGIYDTMKPVAVDLLKKLNDGMLIALPLELNVEGFWYNKKIFADNGIKEPVTWDEMLQAAETLKGKGIQPFSASGDQGWPLTRLIGGYAARKYGPDVMDRVKAGELKLTDAGFVEAAKTVQDMGTKGYFGEGVTTIDYATAVDQFLQGKAAMFYMGSWELRDYNDTAKNKIGAENIGFFSVPTVKDGKGTADAYSMNAGLTVSISKAKFDENPAAIGDWMKDVFSKYGDRAMSDLGMITGFKVQNPPANMSALTKLVQDKIDGAKAAYLWFEAPFNSEATTMSQKNVQQLITGDTTPEQFLGDLQKSLDKK